MSTDPKFTIPAAPRASDPELVTWAERDMDLPTDPARILTGPAAAAHGRSLLADVLGGDTAVERAGGGRPALDPNAPVGTRSPKRQVRLPGPMDERLVAQVAAEDRSVSAIVRDALTDYFDQHPIAS